MKHLISITLACMTYMPAHSQTATSRQLFQTTGKSFIRYYADLKGTTAYVYGILRFLDPYEKSPLLKSTDTLQQQADGSYANPHLRIYHENDILYLTGTSGSVWTRRLDVVKDSPSVVNNRLNNGYFIAQYSAMAEELSKTYPGDHYIYSDAANTWKMLPDKEKELAHAQFRVFADVRLKGIKDSMVTANEVYTRITDHIMQNIRVMDYTALKDSVVLLPAIRNNFYHGKVINALAEQQPEYFLRLLEDLPEKQAAMISAMFYNRNAFKTVQSVQGHDAMKNKIRKEKKADRRGSFLMIGIVALEIGLLVLGAVALF